MGGIEVHRLAAFTTDPAGGNPAGVVVTETALPTARMQAIAAEVGYSETAFLVPAGPRRFDVRYFAPTAEVPFCGHATIASGVLLGQGAGGPGTYVFATASGDVTVDVAVDEHGDAVATLTSVEPSVRLPDLSLLTAVLDAFALTRDDLDGPFPPAIAYAGAQHLILVLAQRGRLAQMSYDFDTVRDLMDDSDLTTIALLWQQNPSIWHARNAFAIGGVVEDPATGAAAAAFGAYLRDGGHLQAPATIEIVQGEDMGRLSELHVAIPRTGGIAVSGHAVTLDGPGTPPTTVAEFFADTPLGVQIHDAVCAALADHDPPVEVRVSKSQVAFRARRGFAWLWRPPMYLRNPAADVVLSIALERKDPSPRFKEVVHPSPGFWQHHLELHDVSDIDGEVVAWLREARDAAS